MTAARDIRVRGVGKVFPGPVVALEAIDLDVEPGEFVCLVGPSGCGKSTLLAAMAGFVRPDRGSIEIGGAQVSGTGPDRAVVFQEYALFPWLSVARNVAFGLEMQRRPADEIAARVSGLLARFGLEAFAGHFPRDLSGGMRQRVAIARALAVDPPLLLMDEPFGALDALTRRDLQDELLRLVRETEKTIVFVTHSLEEALFLGDRVVVMTHRPGRIKHDARIELPRPRERTDPKFAALEKSLYDLVKAEQELHRRDEATRAIR